VYASRNDGDNEIPRFVDLTNCGLARDACYVLSWLTKSDPIPVANGVLFPHGGVVRMITGQPDQYYPPGHKIPPIRRGSEAMSNDSFGKALTADDYSCPPWSAGSDETAAADPTEFSACRAAITTLAAALNGTLTGLTYSQSKQWGKVVRAKIAYQHAGLEGTFLVTSWSEPGSNVQTAVKVEGCGP
jgi:hypothetical protein